MLFNKIFKLKLRIEKDLKNLIFFKYRKLRTLYLLQMSIPILSLRTIEWKIKLNFISNSFDISKHLKLI